MVCIHTENRFKFLFLSIFLRFFSFPLPNSLGSIICRLYVYILCRFYIKSCRKIYNYGHCSRDKRDIRSRWIFLTSKYTQKGEQDIFLCYYPTTFSLTVMMTIICEHHRKNKSVLWLCLSIVCVFCTFVRGMEWHKIVITIVNLYCHVCAMQSHS